MVFDETTKSAPYSLLKDFSQRCPLFYLKKGTAWQDLPLNSFLGEFKSPQTRRSSQNIFSKFTLFLKIKKPQQLGTVGVQPTISELLRFSGANDVTRTHDLLITNQLLYRLSYISVWTGGMAHLKGHIQNRVYFIIFFNRRQQVLLISCRAPYVAVPVYYILYFEGIPSKCFRAIGPFPTVFPRIPPVATGNSVVIFPRNFDKFCHYFLLTLFFLQSSILFSIYIIYLIISFYKELFTFSTWFSTLEFSIYFQSFSVNCINLPSSLFALFHRPKKRLNFT